MASTLTHRGPDDSGEWCDPAAGVAFGFRRLSIIDLSPAGHQPMISASGRYVIVFNGEIYNFSRIRKVLEDQNNALTFRGHSDTEVILAAIETWGVHRAVQQFIGMFAFALWDRRDRVLYLVRDRVGVKPLYYGWAGSAFLFGSELKAFRAHPDFRGQIDRDVLPLFLRHNCIPAPYSIYKGIRKLMPGCILEVDPARRTETIHRYWSASETARRGLEQPFRGDTEDALAELDALLRDAVGLRMIADVPLGVFLSGGVDSSTVTALMQAQSGRPVKTFSIGFHESAYNEAEHARAVAEHLGTEHTELYVTPAEAMAVIPRLPAIFDEPFADSSQIPTFLVSELSRRHVTVSLSGDGGDELFGGYNRYFWGRRFWKVAGGMLPMVRSAAARALTAASPQAWNRISDIVAPLLPKAFRYRTVGDKIWKMAALLNTESSQRLYEGLCSHWVPSDAAVVDGAEPATLLRDESMTNGIADFIDRMMLLDLVTYLPDDILVKVDRSSMAVSLEAREPLLDHRLIEFAWSLPRRMKIRGQEGKWLLRRILHRYVPKTLIERPKMGFGLPIDDWLRRGLRDWAENLLDERRIREEGFLNPEPVRAKWREHLSGTRNWQYHLWDVLMFQAWLEASKRPVAVAYA